MKPANSTGELALFSLFPVNRNSSRPKAPILIAKWSFFNLNRLYPMRFTKKLNKECYNNRLIYIDILYPMRRSYGKATIFNGVFESLNLAKFEQNSAKIGQFQTPRFDVNQVLLTNMAAPARTMSWRVGGRALGWPTLVAIQAGSSLVGCSRSPRTSPGV
jgi:hypothetical protein